MTVKELERHVTASGESIAVYQAGKMTVRLVGSFAGEHTLDELLYSIACQKLEDRISKESASL